MKVGIVGRFQPLQLGSTNLLRKLCRGADEVFILLGSANKYDARNPFHFEEVLRILEITLSSYSNWSTGRIADLGHNEEWAKEAAGNLGSLDYLVSSNDWTIECLSSYYKILDANSIVDKRFHGICSSDVRISMAREDFEWLNLVPIEVAIYILKHDLHTRLVDEFGDEILKIASTGSWLDKSKEAERSHTL